MKITESIRYVGVNDTDLDLFESQYILPEGVSYNSYLIMDEKIALMDTVDARKTEEWLQNVERELEGRSIDYIVVQHMEPDHSGSLLRTLEKYPNAKVVGNAKTFAFFGQFFDQNIDDRKYEVKEGDVLELGTHSLQFFTAAMVHWPEVMVTYEKTEKVLFSADAFGKFGVWEKTDDWACEARRYYFNIVGKYGVSVQALLKKSSNLDIQKILPLHGPALLENLDYYLNLYQTWSTYTPENKGVFVACASIHGNTKKAALLLVDKLKALGEEKVAFSDLSRDDIAECVEDAFRYDRMVLCSASYDGNAFLPMEDFLHHLQVKTYQNRKVALMENGSWAPSALKSMTKYLETMKNVEILPETVSLRSAMKAEDEASIDALAKAVYEAGR